MTHPLVALIAEKAKDAREVFDGTCETAKQAVDYFEQLLLAALEAAPVPDLVEEAGKVLEGPQPRTIVVHHKTPCKCETVRSSIADCLTGIVRCKECGEQIDRMEIVPNPDFDPTLPPNPKNTIRALIALATAQAAQIAGLEADRDDLQEKMKLERFLTDRAAILAGATQDESATLRAKVEMLRQRLQDMVSVAAQDGWDKAMTGRQLIIADARAALSEAEARDESVDQKG